MGLLTMLAGLFGCHKAPKPTQHDLSEITAVSISCGHMDRRYGYFFWIRQEGDAWLFDAQCFTHDHEKETALEECAVDDGSISALFAILQRNDLIAYAENYQKPPKPPFEVMDETTYSFCLTFSDESQYMTYDRQNELEDFFYRLAEQTDE